ncbi:Belongs to the cyclin [Dionaea muscipula]
MAVCQNQEDHSSASFLLDALYCEEDMGEDEEKNIVDEGNSGTRTTSLLPLLFLQQDLFWEDENLPLLFAKEKKQQTQWLHLDLVDESLGLARREAVEYILKVNDHHGFSTLTAFLAINYLDRFLSTTQFHKDKPWVIQLAAVTSLSLAAKVEESQVPLLLDLQVVGTKYLFEAKTIQKMELLVLSSLEWKMHPVTPLSFLDHVIRRLRLKSHLHWEFLRRCERLLLSLVSDLRFVGYPPFVLAAATMLHVIDQIEPSNPLDYQNQLLCLLNVSGKGKVNECYQLVVEASGSLLGDDREFNVLKRKYKEIVPSGPSGATLMAKKEKNRANEQHMPLPFPNSSSGVRGSCWQSSR